MAYNTIMYKKEDGIAVVTINRARHLNALNSEVIAELSDVFTKIESDEGIRVVIITGSGDKAFVAGSDISEMHPKTSITIREFQTANRKLLEKIEGLSKPVIASINGFATGGGCELAMSCDLRIASENAKFGQPEINLGIIPGAGGTQRLTRLVGRAKAAELIYTGDLIDAREALSIGLVNKVVPPQDLKNESRAMAQKLLTKSKVSLSLAKFAINSEAKVGLSYGLDIEMQCFALCFATEDQKEGMSAFLEKRQPQFKGK